MERDEILAMKPGRELDALVGKIFGARPKIEWCAMDKEEKGYYISFDRELEAKDWHDRITTNFPKHPYSADGGHMVRKEIYKRYSEDISAAWEVVEKMGQLGFNVFIEWKGNHRTYANSAEVQITKDLYTVGIGVGTAPEAICKASLLAVMDSASSTQAR